MKYYSKTTGGFYSKEIHGNNISADAVEITDEYHAELLEGQSAGRIIAADKNGYPVLTERLPPTLEELRSTMVLTSAQARSKLASLGLLANIEAMISALPIDNLTQIYWYYATEFKRNDAILSAFCTDKLGMSPEQIDMLFQ